MVDRLEALAERLGLPREYASPIALHVLLAVGILGFGWDVVELVCIYLSELVVVAVLFAVVALFAAQPVADHDADRWRDDPDPDPVHLGSVLPPIYPRNVGLIVENTVPYAIVFGIVAGGFVSFVDRGVSSFLSPTAGLTVLAICGSQLTRVWREFLVEHAYRDRSPAAALELGLRPVARVVIIALYVVVPTTILVAIAAFAVPDVLSRPVVCLVYIVPIGAASVWLQDDAIESVLQHQD